MELACWVTIWNLSHMIMNNRILANIKLIQFIYSKLQVFELDSYAMERM